MKTKTQIILKDVNEHSYEKIEKAVFYILDKLDAKSMIPRKGTVLIKVNLCLLLGPETGATVDPKIAMALVRWLLSNCKVEKIYISEADATHLSADMAFRALGWENIFKKIDRVELLNLSKDEICQISNNKFYPKIISMSKKYMECDYLISLAKLKTHTLQKITCNMKNLFGATAEKFKIKFHENLTEAICCMTSCRMPDLCIVDGLIAMEGKGPISGTPKRLNLLIAGNNVVSTDFFCAKLMGFRPKAVPHLKLAMKTHLGNSNYELLGDILNPINQRFKFLPMWKRSLISAVTFLGNLKSKSKERQIADEV